jgi:hypothetical protein
VRKKCYTEMKYKNMLIERDALQEPPYPAMEEECPLLPPEDNGPMSGFFCCCRVYSRRGKNATQK